MNKRWYVFLSLLLVAVLMTGCATAEQPDELPAEQPRPSAEMLNLMVFDQSTWSENPTLQDFNGVTLTGEAVTEEILAGHKVTMVNIWGTFCGPCISEMPDLGLLSKAYEEGEFQVIGLIADALENNGVSQPVIDMAWEIIDATGADYMHLLPSYDLSVAKLSQVFSVPETIFLDAEGNLLTTESYFGAKSYDTWKEIVDSLLAQQAE